jgi:hypothetical protein
MKNLLTTDDNKAADDDDDDDVIATCQAYNKINWRQLPIPSSPTSYQ